MSDTNCAALKYLTPARKHDQVNHTGLGTCDWTQRLRQSPHKAVRWHDYDQRDSKNADLTREQKEHEGVTLLSLGSSDSPNASRHMTFQNMHNTDSVALHCRTPREP